MDPGADRRRHCSPLLTWGLAALLVGILWVGFACDSQTTPASSKVASSTTTDLQGQIEDGTWDLQIDRFGGSLDATQAFEFLPEADYHPIEDGPTYHVVISLGGARASVEGELGSDHFVVEGKRTSTADGRAWYELDWFAGGRFVVWSTAEGLQGELTGYGSGLPIIFSHRGKLVRVSSTSSRRPG